MLQIIGGKVYAYSIPTQGPEEDGTLEWDHTTLVVVELSAHTPKTHSKSILGVGYTYADMATAQLIQEHLLPLVQRRNPLETERLFFEMQRETRNLGSVGITSMGISAVDMALWDLKAQAFNTSVLALLGRFQATIPAYYSGGFINYSPERLKQHMEAFLKQEFKFFKIKIGKDLETDIHWARIAREILGDDPILMVDANGRYLGREALQLAWELAQVKVNWFEEPVSSDDIASLQWLKEQFPPSMQLALGEYGYSTSDFLRWITAKSLDVLQIDATRCGGITGALKAYQLAEAFHLPVSTHTAPTIHSVLALSWKNCQHIEYFWDHALIENQYFRSALSLQQGEVDMLEDQLGLGIEIKHQELERFKCFESKLGHGEL